MSHNNLIMFKCFRNIYKLEPQIMEINKGPDLGAKDIRDKQVKSKVVTDMFNLVGLIDGKNNQFTKIISTRNHSERYKKCNTS